MSDPSPERPSEPSGGIDSKTPPELFRSLWLLAMVVFVTIVLSRGGGGPSSEEISYSEFKTHVRGGRVAEIKLRGPQVEGVYQGGAGSEGQSARKFVTVLPLPVEDPELMALLEDQGVRIVALSTEAPLWQRVLLGLLPWLVLVALILYSTRRMQTGLFGRGEGPFGYSRSGARRFRKGNVEVGFGDVAGVENAKADLREIVEYLKDPQSYQALGAKIPRGVLLMGPPGTGKTLLAKAVAGEADVPFFSISGSEFVEMFVGVGAARVRDLFNGAKQEAPAIIFIDEIDAVGRTRGAGLGGGHDEREQTLNQILSEMDGFAGHETVIVLAATNRPDVLDPALLRPGRFDRKVSLELPHREARRQILSIHSRKVPLTEDVDLDLIAVRTVGFSGADLENLVNEAALLAGRDRKKKVDMATLLSARDKVLLGPVRDTVLTDQDKQVVAYHESGHALAAWLLPQSDPLEKVTIVPRGQALGLTEQRPSEERKSLRYHYLLDRIAVMLAGRTAEHLVFGEVSSGAEADLKEATSLARRMVCNWGMSERLGPVSCQRGEEHIFLGRELTQNPDFSDHTARLIDEEIRTIIGECKTKVDALLNNNRALLDSLAAALIEHETLDAVEVAGVLGERPGQDPRYSVNPLEGHSFSSGRNGDDANSR